MSGLGIMVLTLLLLVFMATSHQHRGGKQLMLRNHLQKRTCSSPSNCPTGQECCPDKVDEPEGFCADECIIT
uniref:Conotoxin O3 superfamily protein n=1 Tax=Conus litteratus TaxID=89445 RepID=A0AA50LUW6_CONLT|nr:conotoxin precursor O3 superfamily protein [Conus litteratus]